MKKKTKVIAWLEIAVVLCSMFLVALPTIAAEQDTQKVSANTITTTSEDDYVLDIYGNANEDDTIDMRDLTYVKLIFFGKKPETELADAKYDGKINPLDFIQIKLIIVGKEKELTIVDSLDRIVTVKKPVTRIIILVSAGADAIRVLGAENSVAGVSSSIAKEKVLLPVMSEAENVGSFRNPDCEAILALEPDIVIAYEKDCIKLEKKLKPYVTVFSLEFSILKTPEGIRKFGYILDNRKKGEEFIEWYEDHIDEIKERTEELSEDDKPRVFLDKHVRFPPKALTAASSHHLMCGIAGGINIAADLLGGTSVGVDSEWVIEQNPDIIVGYVFSSLPSGYGVDDMTGIKAKREEIMKRPGWEYIKAVKDEDVYLIASDISAGQRVIGTAYMAKLFHPDLFEDLDPQAIHQEYLDRFQRIDYDLNGHGVFVYPLLKD